MTQKWFAQEGRQIIIHSTGGVCCSRLDILSSDTFQRILDLYCRRLIKKDVPLLASLPWDLSTESGRMGLTDLLRKSSDLALEEVVNNHPDHLSLLSWPGRKALLEFVEGLYDFWREFDRFLVLHGEPGPSALDRRPYRAFNATVENLSHIVRALYRDICENLTGDHPRIYRQVAAGCDVGLIAINHDPRLPEPYASLVTDVSMIRHVWITPPLIIDPPINTRTGQFQRVRENPFEGLTIRPDEWLCYPAQVGPLVILVYFHQRFISLGLALSNLFELASDAQIRDRPDAIYFYGVPPEHMVKWGEVPTIFYDDEEQGMVAGMVPGEDRFGYFGYLKKMCLTLHNVVMMKRGRMPYHGAFANILLAGGGEANVLIIGDTATGKSETLEAFRVLGESYIRETRVVADDMGSLALDAEGRVVGYGTEIGAFIRLDDLQQGYAFRQIDRAIIMSPQKVNARVVLPVTTLDEILGGRRVDFILYANNFDQVDEWHPVLDRFSSLEKAMNTFRSGAAMSKGTTSSQGLVHSYFANVFGPAQYQSLHESIARKTFEAAMASGVWIGELRTRLAIPGYESKGPEEAARALLELIREKQAGG